MKVFRWHIFLCISGCTTCCFIHLVDQGSTVFFQEREDISSFCGVGGEGIETGIVGPSSFFTEGLNFSVFFGRGSILICDVGRFTWTSSGSVLSLARTAYLLFDCNDLFGTVERLVSTVQIENPNLVLHWEKMRWSPFLLGPSWPTELRTFLLIFLVC